MAMISSNPATGETLGTYEELSDAELEAKLARAERAFAQHRRTSFTERSVRMRAAADILEREKNELGRLMTLEMGKPIAAAVAEAGITRSMPKPFSPTKLSTVRRTVGRTSAISRSGLCSP